MWDNCPRLHDVGEEGWRDKTYPRKDIRDYHTKWILAADHPKWDYHTGWILAAVGGSGIIEMDS